MDAVDKPVTIAGWFPGRSDSWDEGGQRLSRYQYETNPKVLVVGESGLARLVTAELADSMEAIMTVPDRVHLRHPRSIQTAAASPKGVGNHSGSLSASIDGLSGPEEVDLDAIVVIVEPEYDIGEDFCRRRIKDQPSTEVIILNKCPTGVFRDIILEAAKAASSGQHIYILADEIQVGFPGGEELYQAARDAGVVFFRDAAFEIRGESGDLISNHTGLLVVEGDSPSIGSGSFRVQIESDELGMYNNILIEADQIWRYEGYRPRGDYRALLKRMAINQCLQEYYPFSSSRAGVFVVEPGWEGFLSPGEAVAGLQNLIDAKIRLFSLEGGYQVQPDQCALCLTCLRVCPHGAVRFGQPSSNLYGQAMIIVRAACSNCGRCLAECPAQAITASTEDKENQRTLILACDNSGGPLLVHSDQPYRLFPCAGAISVEEIMSVIRPDTDRIMIITCREGKCQHGEGPERLSLRVKRVENMMKLLGRQLEIEVLQVSAQDRPIMGREELTDDCRIAEGC